MKTDAEIHQSRKQFARDCADTIYLIDMGEDIVWAREPTPGLGMHPDDAMAYVRHDRYDALVARLEALRVIIEGEMNSASPQSRLEALQAELTVPTPVLSRRRDAMERIDELHGWMATLDPVRDESLMLALEPRIEALQAQVDERD